jgi:PHD/YefM family antitoxin component YafN of YafNO toxin-antitoxin module
MTLQTISSEQARTQWRTLLDLASREDVDIVIERHGKATAAVISYETYQAIRPALARMRAQASAKERGKQMAAVLEELAQMPDPAPIEDPVAWQREQRRDRVLPGREQD